MHVVRHLDLQQPVTNRQILDVDLEMHQDFEERGGRILSAIDDAAATRMPATRCAQ